MIALLGFELLRPGATAWTLAGAAVLLAGLAGLRARRRARERLVAPAQLARFLPGFSTSRARARVALAAGAAALLAVALAGPVRGYTVREVRRRGLDLVVCVDTSRSMLVRDLRPDRLERAKREVRGLLDRLGDDRVALLTFAGDVHEVAPLTRDDRTLATLLDTVSTADNRVGGTDLGQALERALLLFDERSGNHEAIVVLTDGEDHQGRALSVARRAGERGIRIYVIGMGTAGGGKIPQPRAGGGEEFLTDREGQEVISALGGETLARVAEESGGAYLAATDAAFPLEEIYEERIARLEGREYSVGEERVPHDRFQWALVLAAACMLVESGLRETRPRKGGAA